jgi:hypothetical protein
MHKKFRIFLAFAISISLLSCLDTEEDGNTTITCTYENGKKEVSSSSIDAFPYKGIKNITFKDSFGITKLFEVTFSNSQAKVVNTSTFFDPNVGQNKTVTNCMDANFITYTLKEVGGQLLLKAIIFNDFDKASPKKEIVDKVEIAISEKADATVTFPIFNMTIDKKNSTDGFVETLRKMDEIKIFNKEFKSVFQNIPLPNTVATYLVYYNISEGIVCFSESNGRKWRFDSMN